MKRFFKSLLILLIAAEALLIITAAVAIAQPGSDTAWFNDSIMYEVFVRSFRDSDGDGIGDLQGVIDGLDHIQSLGANVVWLMPVLQSPSYHGYDVTDYYTVNPDYGTNDDLLALLEAAHARDMRIIMDYVANHTSNEHPFFVDAYGNPQSDYSEFYQWRNDEQTRYASFGGFDHMPSLNYDSQAVRDYMIDVALYWMDPNGDGDPADGVDGFRADVATGPPHDYWQAFRAAVKALNPEVLLLGEVWKRTADELSPYFEDQFDALFDFPVYHGFADEHNANQDGFVSGAVDSFQLSLQLRVAPTYYPEGGHMVVFANNHDTNRVASEVEGDMARLRATAAWLLTLPGTPMIYYGEEIGMQGIQGNGPLYDEYRREPLDWYAAAEGAGMASWLSQPRHIVPGDGISVEEQNDDPDSLLNLYRTLGALRMQEGALRGAYEVGRPRVAASGMYWLWRWDAESVILVGINFSTETVDYNPAEFDRRPFEFDTDSLEVLLEEGLTDEGYTPGGFWIGRWSR